MQKQASALRTSAHYAALAIVSLEALMAHALTTAEA